MFETRRFAPEPRMICVGREGIIRIKSVCRCIVGSDTSFGRAICCFAFMLCLVFLEKCENYLLRCSTWVVLQPFKKKWQMPYDKPFCAMKEILSHDFLIPICKY